MRKLILITFIFSFTLITCYFDGSNIAFEAPETDKIPPRLYSPVRVALYVDTDGPNARAELEAAARYSVKLANNDNKVPYFDYVIIGGGKAKQGKVSAYLELGDSLRNILENDYKELIKPLRGKGIKVLLGVSGGNDGVSFGSLPGEWKEGRGLPSSEFEDPEDVLAQVSRIFHDRVKNQISYAQRAFAMQVADACKYYRLDGVEFWDKDGEKPERNPYPEIGKEFFNGDETYFVENERDAVYHWVRGGGNFVDMLTYMNELFGAALDYFHGGHSFEQKLKTPILVRETNYGRWIPEAVPRYDFTTSMTAITFLVGSSTEEFGWKDTEEPIALMDWITQGCYSPIIIDLVNVSDPDLEDYSIKLGRRRDKDDNLTVQWVSRYGMVYYGSIGPYSPLQKERISVTSREVFDADVEYDLN